jgi:hypothetical protein
MTSAGNGHFPRYDVRMSEHNRDVLQQRHLEAAQVGKGHIFLEAFRQIVARLSTDPLNFGEPLYRLPAMRLQVRQAVVLHLWWISPSTRKNPWFLFADSNSFRRWQSGWH